MEADAERQNGAERQRGRDAERQRGKMVQPRKCFAFPSSATNAKLARTLQGTEEVLLFYSQTLLVFATTTTFVHSDEVISRENQTAMTRDHLVAHLRLGST